MFFNNLHFEIYIWHEICLMSWNLADFSMKSARFHMQMRQFAYKICQISWNLPNFIMKSAEFYHEICWISWPWNLLNFIMNPPNFMKSAGFHGHEIWRISWNQWPWNPPNFMAMKSGGFHAKWAKDQWSYF